MLAEQVGCNENHFRIKQQRVEPDKSFFKESQEIAGRVNAVHIVECNYEAAQHEEEVDKQTRVDDEKVVVKD